MPDSSSEPIAVEGHAPRAEPRPRTNREVRDQLGLADYEQVDNHTNIFFLAGDWLLIAAAIAASEVAQRQLSPGLRLVAYLIAVVAIGSRMRALMNLTHQACHRQLFRNDVANEWCGRVFSAWPLGISTRVYRRDHLSHHRSLGVPGEDPKVQRYRDLGLYMLPAWLPQFVYEQVLKPLFTLQYARWICATAMARGDRVGRLALWAILLGLVTMLGMGTELCTYWLIPLLTSFQVIRQWAEAAEHAGLFECDSEWMKTRSWTSSRLTQWLLAPHSDSHHVLHHQFPRVPHFNYAAVHRLLMRECWEYRAAHHCDGFLLPRRVDAPSALQDMVNPTRLLRYKEQGLGLGELAGGAA
jgi:fatty acid desaturase